MKAISDTLKSANFHTFLPQEDGLELSKLEHVFGDLGAHESRARGVLNRAIFALDVFKLLHWSDAIVANINGRVPDEGTIVEATLAWYSGKAVVLYKDDERSLMRGLDNPMLAALGAFRVVGQVDDLPRAINEQMMGPRDNRVKETVSFGEGVAANLELIDTFQKEGQGAAIARLLHELFAA
jgi:nucleoside 2-deoxyribosyltransferase